MGTAMKSTNIIGPLRAAIVVSILTGMTTAEEMAKVHGIKVEIIEQWLEELVPNRAEEMQA